MLASFFGGNETALVRRFRPLLQDAARLGVDLDFRFTRNERIGDVNLSHKPHVSSTNLGQLSIELQIDIFFLSSVKRPEQLGA
jgi:hypothetical protein